MFDWAAAEGTLHRIAKSQVELFLAGPDADDVYGVGFFCDAYAGTVYLAANTERYIGQLGGADSDVFRWDIGNWKYPGGLFASSSPEQQEFDAAWEDYRQMLSGVDDGIKQGKLEAVCFDVLLRLFNEGVFADAPGLKGFTVLGPDDGQESVIAKRRLVG